jgi:hypothetical protein
VYDAFDVQFEHAFGVDQANSVARGNTWLTLSTRDHGLVAKPMRVKTSSSARRVF